MTSKLLSTGAIVLALGLSPAAQTQLPEGKGRDAVVKMCGTCHPADRGASVRLTREGWQNVMTKMVALGAKGTDEELNDVLEYLATYFKGEAMAPLNLNKATPLQLQSIVGLLRKEATAWVAYRTKTPCTTLDDLKGVEGVDFKKIELRKDRLVCF